jgi:RNA-binding protein
MRIMTLTGKQKHYLRGLAHNRKPVVTIGAAGVSATVVREVDQALDHHELLKLKLPAGDREQRQELLQQICQQTRAELVQLMGRIGTVYRRATEPKIALP